MLNKSKEYAGVILNMEWIHGENDEPIATTDFEVEEEWLKEVYKKTYLSDEFSTYEDFLDWYEPEEDGLFVYKKAVEEQAWYKYYGVVEYQV